MKNIIIIVLAVAVFVLSIAVSSLYQSADQIVRDKEVYRQYFKACEAELSRYEKN